MGGLDRGAVGGRGDAPGEKVGATAARDYLYARLEELGPELASGPGPRRDRAREERDFLRRELERNVGRATGTVHVDPRVAEAMRERASRRRAGQGEPRTVFPLKGGAGGKAADGERRLKEKGASAPPKPKRPPYWAECEAMDFRGLREFMDDALRTPPGPKAARLPRRKEEFLDLLSMLAAKGGIELRANLTPVAVREADGGNLNKLRAYRKKLQEALAKAQRDIGASGRRNRSAPQRVRDLRQELGRVKFEISRLEAQKAGAPRNRAPRSRD